MRHIGSMVFTTVALLSWPAWAQDGAKQGETIFKRQCAACHTLEPGRHKIGPSLAGVVGRKAGAAEGFKYSDALKNSGVVWTEENIEKYLADPKGFIPGNKMVFVGIKKKEELQAVVDYLETVKQAAGPS